MNYFYNNLQSFFEEIFKNLQCTNETKSYIVNIFVKYKNNSHDLSKDKLTILWLKARQDKNFYLYQTLGDWIFFYQSLNHLSSNILYNDIARHSYYSCYQLINKKWKLFEELSDNLIKLEIQTKNILHNIKL